MKYVVDANILFSALYDLNSNAGHLLLLAIEGEVELVSTAHIQSEMKDILVRKLDCSQNEIDEVMKALPVEWIEQEIYEEVFKDALKVLSDEADASLLACAPMMHCEVITGDEKILSSKFKKVRFRRLRNVI